MLYRFDAPLFFANSRFFLEDVLERVDDAERRGRPIRAVVVTAEPITDVDTTAADALDELTRDLDARGVEIRFAELKGHVRERLERYGVLERLGGGRLARTTGEAVRFWIEDTGAEWVDWEDREAPSDGDRP
jgi:MFS superfamily sulfate permease-like transporter